MSQPRIDLRAVAPDSQRGFRQAGLDARENGIEPKLKHLIDIRVSQMNGCAYCLEMHVREAKAGGDSDDRLHLVAAWHETDVFTPRERAALAWTEAITRLSEAAVPEALFHATREHFSEKEMVDLTLVIVGINGWNRLCAPFGTPPGVYQPKARSA